MLCENMTDFVKAVKFMSKVDYFGILTLGTLNFFSTFYYGFFCEQYYVYSYMGTMTISGSSEYIF